jgi:hypothetical protein
MGIGRPVGPLLLLVAAGQAIVALLLFVRAPIATAMWPIPNTGEMTFIFAASILAAAAASMAWAVVFGEPGSLVGIALDYLVITGVLAVYVLSLDTDRGGGPSMFVAAMLASTAFGGWMLWWSWRQPLRGALATPRPVVAAFAVFVLALALAGVALVLQVPNVMPWPLTPELSVVSGSMFLGAAGYFGYGIARPRWSNAGGQLAGFLAYDLVLIVPFVTRFGQIYGGSTVSLGVYTAIVVGSGVLAGWYLFVAPETRVIRARPVVVDGSPEA